MFHSSPNNTDGPNRELQGSPSAIAKSNMHNTMPIKHINVIPTNIDHIPSSTKNSDSNAMLYVFEDNEAMMKMTIKGRSPTMRHVSRTHRVALDWLFDRINLDSKIQIRYIDTKHQLADTRDEWNNLLHLLNISHFSSTCCAKNSSFVSCTKTMAKRMQEQEGEERIVATSKSTAVNLSLHVSASSSSAKSPIASKSPGILIATRKPESRMRRNSKSDAASSSQARLQDAYLGWLMDTATGKTCRYNKGIRRCGSFRI